MATIISDGRISNRSLPAGRLGTRPLPQWRGEALALFLNEEPTYGIFPNIYFYQGRVREGLKSTNFADSYRAYLAIRGASTDDPLVAEARRRAAR